MSTMLSRVTKGPIAAPLREMIYGVEGCGKTTFASQAPAPIFMGAEDGANRLDVARLPMPSAGSQGWRDALQQLEELGTQPHDFKTIVVDTVDSLEPLCWAATCENPARFANNIEDYGFSKGYTFALDEWRKFRVGLEKIQARGMNVLLLAHAIRETVKNPLGDDFDAFAPKLHKKAAAFFKEYVHSILFVNFDIQTKLDKATKRAKGMPGTPPRWIYTQKTAAYEAKSRYALPPKIALRWSEFSTLVDKGAPLAPLVVSINAGIEELLERDASLANKAREALKRAGTDPSKLEQLDAWISAKLELEAPTPPDNKPHGEGPAAAPPSPLNPPLPLAGSSPVPSSSEAKGALGAPSVKPEGAGPVDAPGVRKSRGAETKPEAGTPVRPAPSAVPEQTPPFGNAAPTEKTKRTRRTKEQMEAARAAEKAVNAPARTPDPLQQDTARSMPEALKRDEKALEKAASSTPLGDALGKDAGPFAPDPGYVEDLADRVELEKDDEDGEEFPAKPLPLRSVGDPRKTSASDAVAPLGEAKRDW